jgi:hypothetical protein
MSSRALAAVAAFSVFVAAAAPAEEAAPLEAIAERYVRAQQRVMEKDARPADVDALLAFCTDGFRYVHPAFGAQVDGKDAARRGMLSHLGETTNPKLTIENAMRSGRNVALDVKTSFTVVATGERVERRNIFVLSFDGDRIELRADF